MSMDNRLLRIILGSVLLLVAAFALGTRLAEWDQATSTGATAGRDGRRE